MKENWTYKKLGDCFPYIKNGANIKQERGASGFPITRIETLSGGVFNRDRLGYADIFELDKYLDYILSSHDLLMSHINSKAYIGRTVEYISKEHETIIHGMNLLRLKSNPEVINSSFFAYYTHCHIFKTEIAKIRKDAVNQSSFSISDLKKISVPVPPLETQSRIVSELDLLQSIIDKQQAQLKELDKLAQAVFYDMFGDPVENEKGWEVKKLGELCSKIGSGATPRGGNESYKTEGISLIRSLNVHNNEFVYKDLAFIDEEQAQALSNVEVQSDDILLNITGASVARCCIVPNHLLPARVNQHVCIIRPSKNIEVRYLSRLITNIQYQSFLIDLARGKAATREALPKNIVENLPIILPPLSLQQSFAAKIESIEKQKAAISQSIAETQKLFDYTMDKYFG